MFEDIKKIVYKEDYPKPVSGLDEVLVKVHYCGICGSDVSNFTNKLYQTPLIMGHEFSGEVVALGQNVSEETVKVGDRVVGINVKLDLGIKELTGMGIIQDGGFAEYVVVKIKDLFHIPESISLKESIMIESLANGVRAMRLSKIEDDQKIIIIGGGNIGLSVLSVLLSEKKPKYIIIIEPHLFLREKAKDLGAIDAFPPSKVKINKFLKEHGRPTYIFDCVGNEQTIFMAIQLIKRGGTILVEGIHRGKISFPIMLINAKEICLKGSMGHDDEDILASIDLFEKKKVDPSKFISKVMPLKDIQKAFEMFLEPGERKFVKIVVEI